MIAHVRELKGEVFGIGPWIRRGVTCGQTILKLAGTGVREPGVAAWS